MKKKSLVHYHGEGDINRFCKACFGAGAVGIDATTCRICEEEEARCKPKITHVTPIDGNQIIFGKVSIPMMKHSPNHVHHDHHVGAGDVGVDMTDDHAGIWRRSYNSRRVIQQVYMNAKGNLRWLQLKGSGVPDYGFDNANKDSSGGEYLDVSTIRDDIVLYLRSKEFFGKPITCDFIGIAQVGTVDPKWTGFVNEDGWRYGAVSFRLDNTEGIRLADVDFQSDIDTPNWQDYEPDAQTDKYSVFGIALARSNLMAYDFFNSNKAGAINDVDLRGRMVDDGSIELLNHHRGDDFVEGSWTLFWSTKVAFGFGKKAMGEAFFCKVSKVYWEEIQRFLHDSTLFDIAIGVKSTDCGRANCLFRILRENYLALHTTVVAGDKAAWLTAIHQLFLGSGNDCKKYFTWTNLRV